MTEEHLTALLTAAAARREDDGFRAATEGRLITLYVASNNASLTVNRVTALKVERDLLHARTNKGELFIVALKDVFAGAVDVTPAAGRKAGFV